VGRALLAQDDRFLVVDAAYALAAVIDAAYGMLDADKLQFEAAGALRQTEVALDILDPDRKLRDQLKSLRHDAELDADQAYDEATADDHRADDIWLVDGDDDPPPQVLGAG
jgi:hypothetical protein